MTYRVRNETKRTILADRVERAETLWTRMKGLLGRSELPSGHGLWIERCNSIHTHFMQFAIDAVFVDAEGRVVRLLQSLAPFRMTWPIRKVSSVLELPAGTLAATAVAPGDHLKLESLS